MTTTDKLEQALRTLVEWLEHVPLGDAHQASIEAARTALAEYEAEQTADSDQDKPLAIGDRVRIVGSIYCSGGYKVGDDVIVVGLSPNLTMFKCKPDNDTSGHHIDGLCFQRHELERIL